MAFPTIPTVAAGRVLFANQADASGTRTFPSLSGLTKNAGDTLVAIVIGYQSAGTSGAVFSSWGGGFTELPAGGDQMTTSGSTMCIGIASKISTGSETGTFTVTQASPTGHATLILLSIPGGHDTTPPEAGTIANGTGAAADPGSFNPAGWDAEDTLWIALAASGMTSGTGSWTGTGTTAPTNFTDRADSATADNSTVGQTEGAVAFLQLANTAVDAGTAGVDTSNARNSALVIAIRPAAAEQHSGAADAATHASSTTSTGVKNGVGAPTASHASATTATGFKGGAGTGTATHTSATSLTATTERFGTGASTHTSSTSATGAKGAIGVADPVAHASSTTAEGTAAEEHSGAADPVSHASSTTATGFKNGIAAATVSHISSTTATSTTNRDGSATVTHASSTFGVGTKAAASSATASHASSTTAEGSQVSGASGAADPVIHASSASGDGAKGGTGSVSASANAATSGDGAKAASSGASVGHTVQADIVGFTGREGWAIVAHASSATASGSAVGPAPPADYPLSGTITPRTVDGSGAARLATATITRRGTGGTIS